MRDSMCCFIITFFSEDIKQKQKKKKKHLSIE